MIDKELIKRNFSASARYYDQYSSIQNICAQMLLNSTDKDEAANILDLGCGTGNYTRLLRNRYPKARITALDISPQMIEVAKLKLSNEPVEFIVADAEAVSLEDKYDLITANASLQWLNDLEGTLNRYRERLTENGQISFSIFGPETFKELSASMKEISQHELTISSANFVNKDQLEEILAKTYLNVLVTEKIFSEEHDSLYSLLGKIKYKIGRASCRERV